MSSAKKPAMPNRVLSLAGDAVGLINFLETMALGFENPQTQGGWATGTSDGINVRAGSLTLLFIVDSPPILGHLRRTL